jgi:hypothetical protein
MKAPRFSFMQKQAQKKSIERAKGILSVGNDACS